MKKFFMKIAAIITAIVAVLETCEALDKAIKGLREIPATPEAVPTNAGDAS